ncbi:hypothetical protein RN001_012855 [Aquatica leii]|uniref:Uncharacterized protein n=1 Tax=Aquatica leii TaxID=1421715 RepID=A0AAN7SMM8_9COLE|nr:hypothetical protein RN001_012855 [Aquatica leii]
MHVGSNYSIDLESTEYILQRNAVPVTNNPGLARIKCPLFVSIGRHGFFSTKELVNIRNSFRMVEKHNKHSYLYEVEGTHHVHINDPEILAGPINEFLIKHYLK